MKNHFTTLNILRTLVFSLCLTFASAAILSCSDSGKQSNNSVRKKTDGIEAGGLFRMNFTDQMRSLFPHNVVDATATDLMNQVYEGLLMFDPETNKIVPALAESYTISEDGKIYTFHLRKGVYFHDDAAFKDGKGREVQAQDVVYCLSRLCEPSPRNQLYALVIDLIKGAREHFDAGVVGNVEGLRVINDYTLEIELYHPAPIFESILTHPGTWVFPKELYQYKDDVDVWCIGTGPFSARSIKMNEVVILERNKSYWRKDKDGYNLPYLDAVRCNFIENENRQLNMLVNGNLDLVLGVPYKNITEIKRGMENGTADPNFRIITLPGLRVEYYAFQHKNEIFQDVRIRKAFNYAIDKQFLVDSILLGYGDAAIYGFVPTAMPGYTNDSVKGYTYNPQKAQELFAEAGYENGAGFPVLTLQINDGSSTIIEVADAVQRMLTKNLNLTVEIAVLPRSLHYEQIESGDVAFWRDGWIGDYADPENFLRLFHGKLVPEDSVKASFLNTVRFKDAEFDKNFEESLRERDDKKRFKEYINADQILMDRAAVVPLYYEKQIWLVDKHVRNLNYGGIGMLDLSEVYFSKDPTIATAQ